MKQLPSIEFMGFRIHALTMDETISACDELIRSSKPHQHVVVNAAKVVCMHESKELFDDVVSADIINADGMGVVWAARLLGKRLPERVAGIDLFARLLSLSEEKSYPVYFFGAKQDILMKLISNVKRKYPKIIIAGFRNGYFKRGEERSIALNIKRSGARLLFVGISSPMKERFIKGYLKQTDVSLAMGVGGSFDVMAGKTRRAPPWMQKCGLEWFFRLIQEPRRMFMRYLITNLKFLCLLLRFRFWSGREREMKQVLLTNADNIRTLVFIRSLAGCQDIRLHLASEHRFSAGLFSRFCGPFFINANPKKHPELFLRQMSDYIKANGIDVFIPVNADELDLVLKNRNLFRCEIPFVDYELFRRVSDKWEFARILSRLKLLHPRTVKVSSAADLSKLSLQFPLIIKERVSAGSKGVFKANDLRELEAQFLRIVKKKALKKQDYPLVQEYLEGEYLGASALCHNGKIFSIFTYKSLQQFPIAHGTSTSRISTKDPILEKQVRKILSSLHWHGVAHFDVIKKDGKYLFLEMNPRLYTSLNLTVKSGLNYPLALCRLKNPRLPSDYKSGVVCRIFLSDLLVFLLSRKYSLKEFFREAFFDDLSIKDPLPNLPMIVKFLRGKLL